MGSETPGKTSDADAVADAAKQAVHTTPSGKQVWFNSPEPAKEPDVELSPRVAELDAGVLDPDHKIDDAEINALGEHSSYKDDSCGKRCSAGCQSGVSPSIFGC